MSAIKKCIIYLENQQKLIYFLLGLFLLLFGYYCVTHNKGIDFYTYFIASTGFHEGMRVYLMDWSGFKALADSLKISIFAFPYYYPPLTAQIIFPLILLPPKVAYGIWIFLSIIATALGVYCLANGKNFLTLLLISFGFLAVEVTFYAGQVNALLFLALSFAYYALSKNNNILAGLGIAVGIMLKIIPIAHFGYFIWRGKFKAALAVILFLLVFFGLSLPWVGLQAWGDFFHSLALYSHPSSLATISSNEAVSGLIARLVADTALSIKLWHFSAAFLIVATALVCWPRGEFNSLFDLEFGLVTVAINLVMPYTWHHQNMLLLIPMLLLIKRSDFADNLLLIFLAIGYVIIDWHAVMWHQLTNPLLSSLPTIFALFLWAVLAYKILSIKIKSR